jgi:hypothetical protein
VSMRLNIIPSTRDDMEDVPPKIRTIRDKFLQVFLCFDILFLILSNNILLLLNETRTQMCSLIFYQIIY